MSAHCLIKKSTGKVSLNKFGRAVEVWKKPNSVHVWYIHWRPEKGKYTLAIQIEKESRSRNLCTINKLSCSTAKKKSIFHLLRLRLPKLYSSFLRSSCCTCNRGISLCSPWATYCSPRRAYQPQSLWSGLSEYHKYPWWNSGSRFGCPNCTAPLRRNFLPAFRTDWKCQSWSCDPDLSDHTG